MRNAGSWRRVRGAGEVVQIAGKERRRQKAGWLEAVVGAVALLCLALPQGAQARLQCVPYARERSGIAIFGDAGTWWGQADGVYARGSTPRSGAVLAIAPSRAMPVGHVAVVDKVIDARHILLDHANWSAPGKIERGALAEDVSEAGDWSAVRVWYASSHALGQRINAVAGFIYPERASAMPVQPDMHLASQSPATAATPTSVFDSFDRAFAGTRAAG